MSEESDTYSDNPFAGNASSEGNDHVYSKDGATASANFAPMDTSIPVVKNKPNLPPKPSATPKRQLELTPGKQQPPTKQMVKEPSLGEIFAAIQKVESTLNENTSLLNKLVARVDTNSVAITETKSRVDIHEQELEYLKEENNSLRDKVLEVERYKRRWNLRLSGWKERDGEDIRKKVEGLLVKICPDWADEIEDVVDSVHRVGIKEDNKSRQVIMQFVRRRHRDAVWKATKDSDVCKGEGVRFVEDFTYEDREARKALWPQIKRARERGKTAYYKGHLAVIDGNVVRAPLPPPPSRERQTVTAGP